MLNGKFKNTIKILSLILAVSLVAGCFVGCGEKWEEVEDTEDSSFKFTTEYTATDHIVIEVKDYGTIKVALDAKKAPITVKNFKKLVESGFYDGLTFHRIMSGFMIQGGDPQGTGMGGPGYTIEDEFLDDLRFDGEGILAMANTGMPHTGGSQFFITLDKTPWLNGKHTIFGKVVKGMDVVRTIGHSETDFADRPLEKVVMEKVTIKDAK